MDINTIDKDKIICLSADMQVNNDLLMNLGREVETPTDNKQDNN